MLLFRKKVPCGQPAFCHTPTPINLGHRLEVGHVREGRANAGGRTVDRDTSYCGPRLAMVVLERFNGGPLSLVVVETSLARRGVKRTEPRLLLALAPRRLRPDLLRGRHLHHGQRANLGLPRWNLHRLTSETRKNGLHLVARVGKPRRKSCGESLIGPCSLETRHFHVMSKFV